MQTRRAVRVFVKILAFASVAIGAIHAVIRAVDAVGTGLTLMEIWASVPYVRGLLAHWSAGLWLIGIGWLLLVWLDWTNRPPSAKPAKLLDARGRTIPTRRELPVREARKTFVRACGFGVAIGFAWFVVVRFGYPPPRGSVQLPSIVVLQDYSEVAPGKNLTFRAWVTNGEGGGAIRPYFVYQCVVPMEPSKERSHLEGILSQAWSQQYAYAHQERFEQSRDKLRQVQNWKSWKD